jgi:hypothetical protein
MILHSLGDMNEKNIFLHIDLDMFFCAVEALDDPSLTNRPFVVGSKKRFFSLLVKIVTQIFFQL